MKCANCGEQKNILCVCGFCQDCTKRYGHDELFKIQQKRKEPEKKAVEMICKNCGHVLTKSGKDHYHKDATIFCNTPSGYACICGCGSPEPEKEVKK